MDEMVTLVANMGFPIAISIYLLVRIEGKLHDLTVSLRDLTQVIGKVL